MWLRHSVDTIKGFSPVPCQGTSHPAMNCRACRSTASPRTSAKLRTTWFNSCIISFYVEFSIAIWETTSLRKRTSELLSLGEHETYTCVSRYHHVSWLGVTWRHNRPDRFGAPDRSTPGHFESFVPKNQLHLFETPAISLHLTTLCTNETANGFYSLQLVAASLHHLHQCANHTERAVQYFLQGLDMS